MPVVGGPPYGGSYLHPVRATEVYCPPIFPTKSGATQPQVAGVPAAAVYSWIAAGGLASTGSAAHSGTQSVTPTGALFTGGAARVAHSRTVSGSGRLIASGSASVARARVAQVSGRLQTSGAASVAVVQSITGSGGLAAGGSAGVSGARVAVASGSVNSGGSAAVSASRSFLSSGGVYTSGSATTAGVAADGAALPPPPPLVIAGGLIRPLNVRWRPATFTMLEAVLERSPVAVSCVGSGGLGIGGAASAELIRGLAVRSRDLAAFLQASLERARLVRLEQRVAQQAAATARAEDAARSDRDAADMALLSEG